MRWLSVGVVLGSLAAACPAPAQGVDGLPAYPWDLSTCLAIARRGNLDLAQADASTRAAEGSVKQRYGDYLPRTTSSLTFSRSSTPAGRTDQTTREIVLTRSVNNAYVFEATLFQPVVDLEVLNTIKSTRRRFEQSRFSLEATQEQLDLDVTQRYYDLLKAKRAAQVADEAVQLAGEQLRRTESLYDLGSVPRADVLQSRVALARTELDLISARHSVRDNQAQLALVLGFPGDNDVEIDTVIVLPALQRNWDENELWSWAQEDRGDLKEVVSAVRATRATAAAAQWSRWPSLNLLFFYNNSNRDFGDLLVEADENASWGMRLSLDANLNPIDQLLTGTTVGRVEESRWLARQEMRRLQKKQLEVRLDIRQAVLAWEEAKERLAMSQENVRFAEENLRLQRALYEAGGGTILEWNNAQVELTRAKNELLQAEVDLLTALASLERSVGRPVE